MRRWAITLLAALICTACTQDVNMSAFTRNGRIRLAVGGEDKFVYDELVCQISWSRSKCEFRSFSDNMSDYFSVRLDHVPTSEGEEVSAYLVWSTPDSEMSKKNVAFNVVKTEGDILWLWNNPSKTGAVIRILE